jgi:hypothetical protein
MATIKMAETVIETPEVKIYGYGHGPGFFADVTLGHDARLTFLTGDEARALADVILDAGGQLDAARAREAQDRLTGTTEGEL